MSLQFNVPYVTVLDSDAQIVVGAKAYFYTTGGTFTTPKDVYSDIELTTPISQPILSDAAGRLPRIFLSGQYDVKILYPDDTTLGSWEGVDPGLSSALGNGVALSIEQGGTGAESAEEALTNLGAVSQTQVNSLAATVSDNNLKIGTGLNDSDPTRFGNLASLDQINNTNLVESATLKLINPFGLQLGHYQDVQTSGTSGPTYSSGAWRTVRLNTSVTTEISSIALSSNQLTLVPAGTYFVHGRVPFTTSTGNASATQARIQNITDGATLRLGSNVGSDGTGQRKIGYAEVEGRFTLSGSKTIELQVRANEDMTGGYAGSFGSEVYANLFLWKVA